MNLRRLKLNEFFQSGTSLYFIFCVIMVINTTLVLTETDALTWSDEACLSLDWPAGFSPLGFNSPDIRTALQNGYITYYFRTLFYFPDEEDQEFDRLTLTVHCSDGVIVYLHSVESGRSPSLPAGKLDPDQTAAYSDEDGIQQFDVSWFLTDCAYGWDGNFRAVAVEVHRVDPAASSFYFDAELMGYLNEVPYELFTEYQQWRYVDSGVHPADIAVPTVGPVLYPLTGMPEVISSQQPVQLKISYSASIGAWKFFIKNTHIMMSLPDPNIESIADKEILLETYLPEDTPPGTYDLIVLVPDRGWVSVPDSISVLPSTTDSLTAVHITDSHIPFRGPSQRYNLTVLLEAIEGINKIDPDIVIHTGDGYNEGNARDQAELFASILPEFDSPAFYTPGNHELGDWCGDGENRYHYWDYFGWERLNPERSDHYPQRTRDFIVDIGSTSLFFLESWVTYTYYWRYYYDVTSFLDDQMDWLNDEAIARSSQDCLIACYHHDFGSQMSWKLPLLGFSLSLSGHTHSNSEETLGNTLFLKTASTYGDIRPLRWICIENGNLLEYPLIHLDPVDIQTERAHSVFSYTAELSIHNNESVSLHKLKHWMTMPPDADYTVSGARLIDCWPVPGKVLLGMEYDLQPGETKNISVQPKNDLKNVSFWLDSSTLLCEPGTNFSMKINAKARYLPQTVSAYIVLQSSGNFYFWPDWSMEPKSVTFEFPVTEIENLELFNITWPEIPPTGQCMTFYAVLIDSDTMAPLTPVSHVDVFY